MEEKITLSVIKADVGGFVGHSAMHPELIEEAGGRLSRIACRWKKWSTRPYHR